jgi:hypothetical protein
MYGRVIIKKDYAAISVAFPPIIESGLTEERLWPLIEIMESARQERVAGNERIEVTIFIVVTTLAFRVSAFKLTINAPAWTLVFIMLR